MHSKRPILGALAALIAIGLAPDVGAQEPPKLDAALQRIVGSGAENTRVIVRTKAGARSVVAAKLAVEGNTVYTPNTRLDTIAAGVGSGTLAALAGDPTVLSVSIDAVVEPDAAKNSSTAPTTPTAVTGATDSLSFLKDVLGIGSLNLGSSVVVAVVDSGIAPNGDFAGRIVGQYDFTNGQGGVAVAASDEYGHGTHIAGLIGSDGTLSAGKYQGVAPLVRFVSLKVLDKNGKGRTSDVIDAVEWAIAHKTALGIGVLNISLGHPVYEPASTDPLVDAVERAVRAGIVVVAAAGNAGTNTSTGLPGYGGITVPGNAPSVITVGASNPGDTFVLSDDRVARYSSRGPTWYDGMAKPDVVAPGHGLISDSSASSTLESYATLVVSDGTKKFLKLSGSSMATAVVSGIAALMIDVNRLAAEQRARQIYSGRYMNSGLWVRPPDLTPGAIKAALEYTAVKLHDADGVEYDALTQGAGEVTAIAPLYAAYSLDTTVAPGLPWMTFGLIPTITMAGETLTLGQTVIWGDTVMTGSSLLGIRQSAWDEQFVWGTSTGVNTVWAAAVDDGENIVWGTSIFAGDSIGWSGAIEFGENIVWGTNASWDENIVWGTGLIGITSDGEAIVWGTTEGEAIVWGTTEGEAIVWGTLVEENIVWGTTDYLIRGTDFMGGGL